MPPPFFLGTQATLNTAGKLFSQKKRVVKTRQNTHTDTNTHTHRDTHRHTHRQLHIFGWDTWGEQSKTTVPKVLQMTRLFREICPKLLQLEWPWRLQSLNHAPLWRLSHAARSARHMEGTHGNAWVILCSKQVIQRRFSVWQKGGKKNEPQQQPTTIKKKKTKNECHFFTFRRYLSIDSVAHNEGTFFLIPRLNTYVCHYESLQHTTSQD